MNIYISSEEAGYLLSLLEKESNKADWDIHAHNLGLRILNARED